jgi:hypothetical protein
VRSVYYAITYNRSASVGKCLLPRSSPDKQKG